MVKQCILIYCQYIDMQNGSTGFPQGKLVKYVEILSGYRGKMIHKGTL